MTGLAVLAALWPLAFRRKGGAGAASEAAFYKAQLGEIERDVERGQLPAEEAAGGARRGRAPADRRERGGAGRERRAASRDAAARSPPR